MTVCKICKRNFSSIYLLDKHNNKKYPCGIILQCNGCNKIFKLSTNFDKHLQRKTPCNKLVVKKETEQFLLDKEEIKLQIGLNTLEIIKEKNKLAKQNTKLAKQQIDFLQIKIAVLTESKINIMHEQTKSDEIKSNNRLAIIREGELLKTKRKEQTVNMINNADMIQININNISYLDKTYLPHVQLIDIKTINKNCDVIDAITRDSLKILKKSSNLTEINILLVKYVLNSDEFIDLKNVFHFDNCDTFYKLVKNMETQLNSFVKVDYDIIFPLWKRLVKFGYNILLKTVSRPNENSTDPGDIRMLLHLDNMSDSYPFVRNATPNDQNLYQCKTALSETNTITIDELF